MSVAPPRLSPSFCKGEGAGRMCRRDGSRPDRSPADSFGRTPRRCCRTKRDGTQELPVLRPGSPGSRAARRVQLHRSAMSRRLTVMNDSIWSVPPRPVNAETARSSVRAQHQQIRALLKRAQATAEAALDGRAQSSDAVASAIGDIRTTMEVHLAFEEKVLVPLLDLDVPLGPERARRMLAEHRGQRAMLAQLHHEAVAHPELPTLSVKLTFLTSWLLADMAAEERFVLTPDVVRDDQIAIDQCSG